MIVDGAAMRCGAVAELFCRMVQVRMVGKKVCVV